QLSSATSVAKLATTTLNSDLKRLLLDLYIGEKIDAGYQVRAIFVTNVAANSDAVSYINHAAADGHNLDVWDLARLTPVLAQLRRDWFVQENVRFQIEPKHLFYIGGSKTEPNLVYAAVRARELVRLPGIDDMRIFAQNVRLGLGTTRVNDDIVQSVRTKPDHKDFLTFHNGLTIVAKSIAVRGRALRLKDFSVCNGCQSLLTFYNNRKLITDALEVLVRIVRVGDDRRLPEIIAYRTNNQNAISLRDLASNDTTQLRLQAEFNNLFGNSTYYSIKAGELTDTQELPNE